MDNDLRSFLPIKCDDQASKCETPLNVLGKSPLLIISKMLLKAHLEPYFEFKGQESVVAFLNVPLVPDHVVSDKCAKQVQYFGEDDPPLDQVAFLEKFDHDVNQLFLL